MTVLDALIVAIYLLWLIVTVILRIKINRLLIENKGLKSVVCRMTTEAIKLKAYDQLIYICYISRQYPVTREIIEQIIYIADTELVEQLGTLRPNSGYILYRFSDVDIVKAFIQNSLNDLLNLITTQTFTSRVYTTAESVWYGSVTIYQFELGVS